MLLLYPLILVFTTAAATCLLRSPCLMFWFFCTAVRRAEPCPPASTADTAAAVPETGAAEGSHAPPLGAEEMAAAHARVTSKVEHERLKRDLIEHVWARRPDA